MAGAERVSIGFSGGGVVEVKITAAKLKDLRKALDKANGFIDLETEDGVVSINLSEVDLPARQRARIRASASAADRSLAMRAPEGTAPRTRPGGRGRRPVVEAQPLGLPVQPALLGPGAAPVHHPRAPRRDPGGWRRASGSSRSAPGPGTTRSTSRSGPARRAASRSSTSSARCSTTRCAARPRSASETCTRRSPTPPGCPTTTRASTPPTSSPCSARSPTRRRRCASLPACCGPAAGWSSAS